MFERKSTLERLAEKEMQLCARKSKLTAAIAAAEHAAGAALLDDRTADAELSALVRAKAELGALDVAVLAVRKQRSDAILATFATEAGKLRESARAKTVELGALQAKVTRLIGELSLLERCKMQAMPDRMEPFGHMIEPLTAILTNEIASLNTRADGMEAKQVPSAGRIDLEAATSAAEMVRAVLEHPSAGPSAEAVEKWLGDLKRDGRPMPALGDAARRAYVVWGDDGRIDLNESYLYVGELAIKTVHHNGFSYKNISDPSEAVAREAARYQGVIVATGTFTAAA